MTMEWLFVIIKVYGLYKLWWLYWLVGWCVHLTKFCYKGSWFFGGRGWGERSVPNNEISISFQKKVRVSSAPKSVKMLVLRSYIIFLQPMISFLNYFNRLFEFLNWKCHHKSNQKKFLIWSFNENKHMNHENYHLSQIQFP